MARQAFPSDLVQAEIELEEVKEALRGWDMLDNIAEIFRDDKHI